MAVEVNLAKPKLINMGSAVKTILKVAKVNLKIIKRKIVLKRIKIRILKRIKIAVKRGQPIKLLTKKLVKAKKAVRKVAKVGRKVARKAAGATKSIAKKVKLRVKIRSCK